MTDPEDRWTCGDSLKWWDGYDGHTDIILDDFRGDYCKFAYLLKILDRYPLQVEVKGGMRQLRCRNIFITSDVHPELIYGDHVGDKSQLLRRISKIVGFGKNGPEVMDQRSGVILCPDLKTEIINFKWDPSGGPPGVGDPLRDRNNESLRCRAHRGRELSSCVTHYFQVAACKSKK